MKKPLLIIDFEHSGHHAFYMRHVARYALANHDGSVKLLISRALRDRTCRELSEPDQDKFLRSVRLLEDDPVWVGINARVKKHSLACWLYFEYINWKHRGDRILLIYLETLVYGVALSPLPRFECSMLMFRPTFYYHTRKMLSPGLKSLGMFCIKWVTAFILRLRPGASVVLTLDPLAEAHARDRWGTDKFRCIADPFGPEPGDPRPLGLASRVPGHKLRMVLAGMLGPRKGLREIVEAVALLPPALRERLVFTAIGEPEPGQSDYVRSCLDRAKSLAVDVQEDLRFVTSGEIDIAIENSDLVLVPYRGFKGSSGILIRAAHFGKPVISTNDGLMAYFVGLHKLGAAIDVGDPTVFGNCLKSYMETGLMEGFDPLKARRYADESAPELFVRGLLQTR